MKSKTAIVALSGLLVSAIPFSTAESATPAEVKVERVGQPENGIYPVAAVSSDGSTVTTVMRQGSRMTVAVNGQPGPTIDGVESQSMVVNADGQRHAFFGTKSGKQYLFVDGKAVVEIPPGTWFPRQPLPFQFSPDGRRYALILSDRVIVDGKPFPTDGQAESFHFSADGRHYGYVAGGQAFADGKAISPPRKVGMSAQAPVQFTAKSGRPVYLWHQPSDARSVCHLVDGKKKSPMLEGSCHSALLSEVGDHTAYAVSSRIYTAKPGEPTEKARYVIDLHPQKEFIRVSDFRFNKDGTRWAYAAQTAGGYVVVVNGKPTSLEYEHVEGVIFGPDQKTVFATAAHAGKYFLLMNDKEYGPFAHLPFGGRAARKLVFSPDGKHHAFLDGSHQHGTLVVDGKAKQQKGQAISNPLYMADGRLTYLANDQQRRERRFFIEGEPIGPSVLGLVLFSPDRKHYAYLSDQPKGRFYVVDGESHPHPGGSQRAFSPDSRHFANVGPAEEGNGNQVYLDGEPVGPVFGAVLTTTIQNSGETYAWFRFNPDGNLVVLTQESDNTIQRITISP